MISRWESLNFIAVLAFSLFGSCSLATSFEDAEKYARKPDLVLTTGHAGLIQEIAFSRDGRFFLTGSTVDGTRIVWNTTTFQEYGRSSGSDPKLMGLFSRYRDKVYSEEPDGIIEYTLGQKNLSRRVVVAASQDLPVALPRGDLGNFDISPDGEWLAYCRLDRSVHLRNLASNADLLVHIPSENGEIYRIVLFDRTSSRLLVWWPESPSIADLPEKPGHLFLYAITGGKLQQVLEQTVNLYQPAFAFDRSSNLWLASIDRHSIDAASLSSKLLYAKIVPDRRGDSQIEVRSVTLDFVANGVQFSEDARFLFVPGILGIASDTWADKVPLLESEVSVLTPPTPPPSPGFLGTAAAMTISPDGSKIAMADFLGNIVVWDTPTHTSKIIPSGRIAPINSVDVTYSESFLLVGDGAGSIRVWDLAKGLRSTSFRAAAGEIAVASNSDHVAFFDSKGELTMLDPRSNEYHKLGVTGKKTSDLRFVDRDSKIIWIDEANSDHPSLRMWDLSGKADAVTLCHFQKNPKLMTEHRLTVSSSGRTFAAFCSSGKGLPPEEIIRNGIYVWTLPDPRPKLIDVEDKEELPTLSPDGNYLVIGSTEELVNLRDGSRSNWSSSTFDRTKWSLSTFPTGGIQFSKDGDRLFEFQGGEIAAWSDWPSRARRGTRVFSGAAPITSLATTKSGRLWLGKMDGTVSLVSAVERRELLRLFSISGAGWASVTQEGLFDGEADAIKWIGWKNPGEVRVTPVDTFFDSFYYPGLLSEFARGLNPIPKGQTIADMLDLPGLDYLIDLRLASFGYEDGSFGICLAGTPTADLFSDVEITYKGVPQDLSTKEFRETDLADCRNFLQLSGEVTKYEINARSRRKAAARRPLHPPKPTDVYRSDVTVHLQTITYNSYVGFDSLSFPSADGTEFVKYFSTEAFKPEKEGGPVIRPWRALDDTADLNDIRDRLDKIGHESNPQDIVLLFFSGHGTVLPGQQMYFFIPNTVKANDRDAIRLGALNSAMLADAIRNMKARRILVVLDSCQSGGVLDSLRRVADSKVQILRRQISKQDSALPKPSVAIIAAATPFQLAAEQAKVGHGFLTKAFLDALRTDSSDVTELSKNLGGHMDALTRNIREKQNPEILLAGNDFFLNSRRMVASTASNKPQ